MERFVKKVKASKQYRLLIGHKYNNFLHPDLFLGRKEVTDTNGKKQYQDKYVKSYKMNDIQLREMTVFNWSSDATALNMLEPKQKVAVNSIKMFINCADWKTLMVFHDKECDENPHKYGNHLHIIIETDQKNLSRHHLYRNMYGNMCNTGGVCSLQALHGDQMSACHYLSRDPEKIFLGTNDTDLLQMYTDSENMPKQQMRPFMYEDEEDVLPQRTRDTVKPSIERQESKDKEMPNHLKQTKSVDTVKYLTGLLEEYPECATLHELLGKIDEDSPDYTALCTVGTTTAGKQAFSMALQAIKKKKELTTIYDRIKQLPEVIPKHMTPRQSQAIFNAWCAEQGRKPKYICKLIQMLTQEKGHKRIGLYLQGAPNSGKTALTNSIWNPIKDTVGKITKGDSFSFMDCAGKKIVVGEEIAITAANIEKYKDMMSGATVKVEVKNKGSEDCTPCLVLLNSNMEFSANLNRQQISAMKARLYNISGLKRSSTLRHMTGHLHPRLFTDEVEDLTEDDIAMLGTGVEGDWGDEPIGRGEVFSGNWDEIRALWQTEDVGNTPKPAPVGTRHKSPENIWAADPIVISDDPEEDTINEGGDNSGREGYLDETTGLFTNWGGDTQPNFYSSGQYLDPFEREYGVAEPNWKGGNPYSDNRDWGQMDIEKGQTEDTDLARYFTEESQEDQDDFLQSVRSITTITGSSGARKRPSSPSSQPGDSGAKKPTLEVNRNDLFNWSIDTLEACTDIPIETEQQEPDLLEEMFGKSQIQYKQTYIQSEEQIPKSPPTTKTNTYWPGDTFDIKQKDIFQNRSEAIHDTLDNHHRRVTSSIFADLTLNHGRRLYRWGACLSNNPQQPGTEENRRPKQPHWMPDPINYKHKDHAESSADNHDNHNCMYYIDNTLTPKDRSTTIRLHKDNGTKILELDTPAINWDSQGNWILELDITEEEGTELFHQVPFCMGLIPEDEETDDLKIFGIINGCLHFLNQRKRETRLTCKRPYKDKFVHRCKNMRDAWHTMINQIRMETTWTTDDDDRFKTVYKCIGRYHS